MLRNIYQYVAHFDGDVFRVAEQQIGSVNSLVEDSAAMKVPNRKMTYRRTLPKVAPLKGEFDIILLTTGSLPEKGLRVPKSTGSNTLFVEKLKILQKFDRI